MSTAGHLLIRADSTTRMGSGHVMRCLALAQGWKELGGDATFLSCCEGSALEKRVSASGFHFIPLERAHPAPTDLESTLSLLEGTRLESTECNWLAIDGYHFDLEYQQAVRRAGYRLLVVDDTACWPEYEADVLLNQNINAVDLSYVTNAGAELLLGPRYSLLRQEFRTWAEWQRTVPQLGRKVLVTMGGGDPDNVTLRVLEALNRVDVPQLEAKVVVGPANPHHEILSQAVASSQIDIELLDNVTDMPGLMAWDDVAVSAAGSTCWELAFMGLPSILMVLADNQVENTAKLVEAGVAESLGWASAASSKNISDAITGLLKDPKGRETFSELGRRLVDGRGCERVTTRLLEKPSAKSLGATAAYNKTGAEHQPTTGAG